MSSPAKEMTMPTKVETVIADVVRRIRSGEYPPGSKLPSAREMRETFDVSQMTIRTAVERLRAEGWVTTSPGAGVFVSENPPM